VTALDSFNTGANGYLGAHCVERWARASTREMVATWHSDREHLVASPPPHLHYEQCDLTDARAVDALFTQWNISDVVHIAALVPDGESHYLRRAVSANVAATAHLVDFEAGVRNSDAAYCIVYH
jgi:UDP-glucose 4-epimerase